MLNRETRQVRVDALRQLMEELLAAAGCDAETAAAIANVHLEADLRGIGVQGLNHLVNSHVPKLRAGKADPGGKPHIAEEGEAFALIDGANAPGPIAGLFAADVAARKGRQAGSCIVGVTNSHDMYIAGYYAERIARAGLVGFVFSDDVVPVVHPLGGAEPVIGSNPMAIAMPTETEPFLLDFAPCATLPTYVRYAKRYGVALPEGVACDSEGRPTTDATKVCDGAGYQTGVGAISPLGNKGYGLLLAIDFLSGAFVGCDMGPDHATAPGARKGHFFMSANPAVFGALGDFERAVSGRIRQIKDTKTAPDVSEIQVPGERSFAARAEALRMGEVAVDAVCWKDTAKLAGELGVMVPD